ncbi:armadillo-like helical domain-containing protein 2 [Salmo salar]|uniref:Armadillo-like helical domain-containing protein 2 n=1 Tax=Salmo salar TaxID=8030 RepID=A0A1S3Q2X5_SALSA|nr:armadillo-like helical domain-containing protein 2 [Salmo salar]
MIQRIALFYSNHIKNYLFPNDEGSDEGDKNLHYRKIRLAGQDIQDTELPLEKRVLAVHNIGLLGYTGGYAAATCAAEYMPAMADFLKQPSLSDDQRISVLEGLSGVCYVHLTNQKQAHSMGLYATLQELMDPTCPLSLSTKAKMWSCYLLNILCCNNIPVIRTLVGSQSLRLTLEALEGQDWYGWPKNCARELLCMLGFWAPQVVTALGAGQVTEQNNGS